jgi:hypothetical protein
MQQLSETKIANNLDVQKIIVLFEKKWLGKISPNRLILYEEWI